MAMCVFRNHSCVLKLIHIIDIFKSPCSTEPREDCYFADCQDTNRKDERPKETLPSVSAWRRSLLHRTTDKLNCGF